MAVRPLYRYERLRPEQAPVLLRRALGLFFPHFADCSNKASALLATAERLEADLHEMLGAVGISDARAEAIIEEFFERLPEVAEALHADAAFIAQGDPAASSVDEVVLAYPGFFAIAAYRVAHVLQTLEVPIVPRLITEHAHTKTGVDIHPGARIGVPFFVDHGTGVVIGETARIGRRVKLYQGVTLGALSVDATMDGVKRHPTIEDDCILYANAIVLGGETTVGANSIIGGNVWLTASVPPNALVVRKAEVRVRTPEEDGVVQEERASEPHVAAG